MKEKLVVLWYRLMSGGWIPARLFFGDVMKGIKPQAKNGRLHVEVVSHCWAYSHMQIYQLSSIVNHPPTSVDLTMTVFYNEEDELTAAALAYFSEQNIPGVTWNWQALPKPQLFRRAIGRNQAAKASQADWLWFTDCDLLFGEGCLDALGDALQGLTDLLVYPDTEHVSELLPDEHPMLAKEDQPRVKDFDPADFYPKQPSRATGPLQVVHGDVARQVGYCGQTGYFMQPVDRWAKTYEDTTFRWILGSQGRPISVPNIFRIRHQSKGRYKAGLDSRLRQGIRRATDNHRNTDGAAE